MLRMAVTNLILAMGFTAFSETINISGTVTHAGNGRPVNGAIVTLAGQGISDTTDAGGAYTIKGNQVALSSPAAHPAPAERIALAGGTVELRLSAPAAVKIELFDMQGNLLQRVTERSVAAGAYRCDLENSLRAAQMMVVKVSIGGRVSTFRHLPLNHGRRAIAAAASEGGGLVAQTVVDSLKVTARSFIAKGVTVSAFQGTKDIALDTINLDYFSFFVTSLDAIKALSESDNGFGGDLRFHHTGPGAGLRGADSICQCIAERSQEGSKVKIWRAFLSSSTDENGRNVQVNAIERIGTGPWYDREGRMLAPSIADLLHDRPANGDTTIRNDLPNEDGIPNSQPDPDRPAVDNHHMLTGTGTDGKLYSKDATCNDWTSVTAAGGPYGGLSWPRKFGPGGLGGSHWMAGLVHPGCKAGVAIEQGGGPEPGCTHIGCGGGYGGFYCFARNP